MADSLEILKCPACNKKMEKIYIPENGVNIDICIDGCGGIYFDNREFDMFNEQNEDIDKIIEKIKGKTFQKVDTDTKRICPSCGAPMVKNTTKIGGEVVVDDCYTCGGKFLDNDELIKIRAEFPTDDERSAATLKYLFQTAGQELSQLDSEKIKKHIMTDSYFNVIEKIIRHLG